MHTHTPTHTHTHTNSHTAADPFESRTGEREAPRFPIMQAVPRPQQLCSEHPWDPITSDTSGLHNPRAAHSDREGGIEGETERERGSIITEKKTKRKPERERSRMSRKSGKRGWDGVTNREGNEEKKLVEGS